MITKYTQFIGESRFLRGASVVGYLDKSKYPGIDGVLPGLDQSRILSSQDALLWDYGHEETTRAINEFAFRAETEAKFDLGYLRFTREPIEVGPFAFVDFVDVRVNHYMIKSNDSVQYVFGELGRSGGVRDFVSRCLSKADELGLDTRSRYAYLTVDQNPVEPGKTQRESGWHIDGMQGTEVPEKKPADFQFIWTDATPTRFCTQTFDVEGLDVARHNVFNWLSRQVAEQTCYSLREGTIYLMNAYHVHTATPAKERLYRRFVRLSFTNTPITSVKMTPNPDIHYNYPTGVTSGDIPKGLV
jgi:hypothetical protein